MPRQDCPWGCPYPAVGMQRALDSAIGLPRRSTSASWMLAFLMPADVSSNLIGALFYHLDLEDVRAVRGS